MQSSQPCKEEEIAFQAVAFGETIRKLGFAVFEVFYRLLKFLFCYFIYIFISIIKVIANWVSILHVFVTQICFIFLPLKMKYVSKESLVGLQVSLISGTWECHLWVSFVFEVQLSVNLILNVVIESFELFM